MIDVDLARMIQGHGVPLLGIRLDGTDVGLQCFCVVFSRQIEIRNVETRATRPRLGQPVHLRDGLRILPILDPIETTEPIENT